MAEFDENSLNTFNTEDGSGNDTFSYAYADNILGSEIPATGVKSLFNEYAMFRYHNAAGDNKLLFDKGGKTITPPESRNPTAHNIIHWALENSAQDNPFGATPYSWSDFLYCTYYGHIPNNYMITLRRYPIPMTDNLKTHNGSNMPPVSQAVTWMSEATGNKLSELMKFTVGLNWKEIEAKVQEVTGNEKGFESSPFAQVPGGNILAGVQGFLNPRSFSGQAQSESDYAREAWGSEGPYANKVYGPVNVIHKTMARDQGLHFEQEFSIKFHYNLRSINRINPKMALLDILANMLTLTYNNAKFWGGAIRYFPQAPNVPFFGDQDKFYSGDVGGYVDSVIGQFQKIGGEFEKTITKLIQDPASALKELLMGGGKFIMGKIAAKDRPQIIATRSLLTGAPVGEWHMVIGNPMNPIAMIGNLICTDMEVEFSDMLGPDDFPDQVIFTIKLKHGRPRDKGDIESMFNLGNGRLYYGINDNAIFSSTHNSNIDTLGATDKGSGAGKITDTNNMQSSFSDITAPRGKSMWGGKFKPEELRIAKVWSGGASGKTAPKK